MARAILKEKEEAAAKLQANGRQTRARNATQRRSPSKATERQVAQALGQRVPVPKALQPENTAAAKARKDLKMCKKRGQEVLDDQTFSHLADPAASPDGT